jgi:aromatic-L-amino-acid decarboxylase
VWHHCDAAYAGAAAILPEHRSHFTGLDLVESFSFNPHKWLLTTFDCCALWVEDSLPLRQALNPHTQAPMYLRSASSMLDYKDWQIPLGRRFR